MKYRDICRNKWNPYLDSESSPHCKNDAGFIEQPFQTEQLLEEGFILTVTFLISIKVLSLFKMQIFHSQLICHLMEMILTERTLRYKPAQSLNTLLIELLIFNIYLLMQLKWLQQKVRPFIELILFDMTHSHSGRIF